MKNYLTSLLLVAPLFAAQAQYTLTPADVVIAGDSIAQYLWPADAGGKSITDIIIPSDFDGQTVKTIGSKSFNRPKGKSSLKSVVVADGIEHIGTKAFIGNSLSALELPDGLKTVGDSAFCETWDTTDEGFDFKLPDALEKIGVASFMGMPVKNLSIGPKLTRIPALSFADCRLSEVVIPGNITHIEQRAFELNWIKKIVIPSTLRYLNGFNSNMTLEEIKIPATVETVGDKAFSGCSLKSITIAEGVKAIGREAFAQNIWSEMPMDIFIPKSIVCINPNAFSGINISILEIAEGITQIDPYAFSGASIQSNLVLPQSLKTIGQEAFRNALGIHEINIDFPQGLEYIGKNAFSGIASTKIALSGNNLTVDDGAFGQPMYLKELTIGPGVTTIGKDCFRLELANTTWRRMSVDMSGAADLVEIKPNAFKDGDDTRQFVLPTGKAWYTYTGTPADAGTSTPVAVTSDLTKGYVALNATGMAAPQAASPDARTTVYDLTGRRVTTDTDALPRGAYIVKQGSRTTKILVK